MIVLVTGGASSGKSAFAERVACALPAPHVYLATMRGAGAEAAARIERHRALRAGKGFETVECPNMLESLAHSGSLPDWGTVLLEDLGNLAANEMFAEHSRTASEVMAGIDSVASQCANLVIVTNEIGSDGCSYDDGTRAYLEFLGALACACAARADAVVEVVAGTPRILKDGDGGQSLCRFGAGQMEVEPLACDKDVRIEVEPLVCDEGVRTEAPSLVCDEGVRTEAASLVCDKDGAQC